MPPKAKRYRVYIREVITNRWIPVATELTDKQSADMVRNMTLVDVRRELITDDAG
jgi:hypothetical protein